MNGKGIKYQLSIKQPNFYITKAYNCASVCFFIPIPVVNFNITWESNQVMFSQSCQRLVYSTSNPTQLEYLQMLQYDLWTITKI